ADFNLVRKDDTTVVPLSGYVATLRPGEGRFGGAVAVEEGTTNCIVSRDFETWASYVTGNATGTVEFRQDPIYGKVVKLKKTDGGSGRFGLKGTLSGLSGSIYTHSVYVRALSGTGRIACMYVDAAKTGGGLITSQNYRNLSDLPLGQWVRIATAIDGSPDTLAGGGSVYVWVDTDNGECEFAYPQVEAKPFATSFVDGTRAAGVLTYDASIMPVQSATVAAWVWVPPSSHWPTTSWRRIISNANDFAARTIALYLSPTDRKLYLELSDNSNTRQTISSPSSVAEGWHHVVATWDASRMALYVDGSLVAQKPSPSLPTSHPYSWIAVGSRTDDMDHLNGLIDELLILP
ncbi:MAG TPA: LamG domain-containing protein, partial [Bacillota bacterium]|nr:LamG domain-containing protein [Bacillota bacterium]